LLNHNFAKSICEYRITYKVKSSLDFKTITNLGYRPLLTEENSRYSYQKCNMYSHLATFLP